MIKKRSVFPVKYMLKYWTHVSAMKKCGVTFTSWITRIASRLGMLENVILTYIPEPQTIIG